MVEICGRAQLAPTELKAFCVWRLDWVGGGLGFGGSKPPALRYCGLIKRLVECGRMVSSPTIELLRLDLVVGCLRTVGDTGIALLPALATPSHLLTQELSQSESLSQGCWLNASRPTMELLWVDKAVGNMRTAEDVCPYNKTPTISQSFCRQKATRACSRL